MQSVDFQFIVLDLLKDLPTKKNIFPVDSTNDGFPLGKIVNLLMKGCLIIKFKIKTMAVKHNNHQ
jgi:hypothetical protein